MNFFKDPKYKSMRVILLLVIVVFAGYFVVSNMNQSNSNQGRVFNPVSISPCLPTTTPWIKAISPNGGETYLAGQQITVKWTSCNIPTTTTIGIQLEQQQVQPIGGAVLLNTVNDGSELVTLPTLSSWGSVLVYGNNYKIKLFYGNGASASYDLSDNLFTINAPVVTPSITVLSPNGGETYLAGQQITVKWTTQNIPATANLAFSLFMYPGGSSSAVGDPLTQSTLNDGEETFTLPTSGNIFNGVTMQYGKLFKIYAAYQTASVGDTSDNLFTIIKDPMGTNN